jgi:hypothetical protein
MFQNHDLTNFHSRYLYSAKLPDHLNTKVELADLTKLSDRFNVQPIKNFVKRFDQSQFDDDEEDNVDNGGFIECLKTTQNSEEVIFEIILALFSNSAYNSRLGRNTLTVFVSDLFILRHLGKNSLQEVVEVASATQNLDLLLDAFAGSDVTQSSSLTNGDAKRDERDEEWDEMCDFLTQKKFDDRTENKSQVRVYKIFC